MSDELECCHDIPVALTREIDHWKARADRAEVECVIHREVAEASEPLIKELIADRDRLNAELDECRRDRDILSVALSQIVDGLYPLDAATHAACALSATEGKAKG